MKKSLLLFGLFILGSAFLPGTLSSRLTAQNLGPSLSLTGRYGLTPYEYIGGVGGGLHLTYPLSQHFYLSGGLGVVTGKMEVQVANDRYFQRETFANLDLGVLVNLTPNQPRNRLGLGLGGSFNATILNHARTINLPEIEMATHFAEVFMLNLILEEAFFLDDHWGLIGRLTGRSSLVEKAVLERNFTNGIPSTIGGIRNSFTLDLGVSYRFGSR